MKLSDFKVGSTYQYNGDSKPFQCMAVVNGYPIMVLASPRAPSHKTMPFIVADGYHWKEIQEWVVLMWGDEHKNSVVVNSEFFPSEQAAINKWVENPLYIGTKQVR